mmetsp:Transcript_20167/g.71320  ORF Transcript_20167/g.71320 Transcript_20167/m.71320 type:complete len:441 (+) Transcript_20167:1807-3129(+)
MAAVEASYPADDAMESRVSLLPAKFAARRGGAIVFCGEIELSASGSTSRMERSTAISVTSASATATPSASVTVTSIVTSCPGSAISSDRATSTSSGDASPSRSELEPCARTRMGMARTMERGTVSSSRIEMGSSTGTAATDDCGGATSMTTRPQRTPHSAPMGMSTSTSPGVAASCCTTVARSGPSVSPQAELGLPHHVSSSAFSNGLMNDSLAVSPAAYVAESSRKDTPWSVFSGCEAQYSADRPKARAAKATLPSPSVVSATTMNCPTDSSAKRHMAAASVSKSTTSSSLSVTVHASTTAVAPSGAIMPTPSITTDVISASPSHANTRTVTSTSSPPTPAARGRTSTMTSKSWPGRGSSGTDLTATSKSEAATGRCTSAVRRSRVGEIHTASTLTKSPSLAGVSSSVARSSEYASVPSAPVVTVSVPLSVDSTFAGGW